ncbi:MAG: phage tail protein [Acidobacteriota bacterium]
MAFESFEYPQPGFHFVVLFELFPQFPNDIRFQSVSGLRATTRFKAWAEGGENRFSHQLPEGLEFADLVLKRGKFMGSGILHWARKAVEGFEFTPTNLMVSLLDSNHLPLFNWYVVGALPKQLEVSGIDAMTNAITVETLTLTYQHFKYYDPASVALDAAAALTGSVDISL